ncbi:MAG: peptidoglycan-binding domain-containing protein [Cyanobacteriota bacterium]|nr:peptidoglycan-binding domain-containing protein [Cyanobacteriota bacterium]
METLAYLHLVLTYENSQDEPEIEFALDGGPLNFRGSRTRSQCGILAAGTVLGLLGTTTNALALLQHGDRNPQVTRVQKRLQELNFFEEDPTGYFGEVTTEAVKEFQRDRQIAADGIVGSETEAALFEAKTAQTSDDPFNTDGFLASPTSKASEESPKSEKGENAIAARTPESASPSSSQNEQTSAFEETGFKSENLELNDESETVENSALDNGQIEAPGALAERVAAREQPTLLKPGARGESVKHLQEKLEQTGFAPGEIDGIYGPQTKKAVIAFQRSRGLFVDGIAGQQTLSTLKIGASEPPQRLYEVKVRNS